jgi:hypothetical protein
MPAQSPSPDVPVLHWPVLMEVVSLLVILPEAEESEYAPAFTVVAAVAASPATRVSAISLVPP